MAIVVGAILALGGLLDLLVFGGSLAADIILAALGAVCIVVSLIFRKREKSGKAISSIAGAAAIALSVAALMIFGAPDEFVKFRSDILATTRLIENGRADKALENLDKMLETDTEHFFSELHINRAVAYLEKGDNDAAQSELSQLDGVKASRYAALYCYNRAVIEQNRDNDRGAEDYALDALRYKPDHLNSLLLLGKLYQHSTNPQLAVYYLETALVLEPRNPEVLFELGRAHFNNMYYDVARECFAAAIEYGADKQTTDEIDAILKAIERQGL